VLTAIPAEERPLVFTAGGIRQNVG
jgi:hypothetical protein